MIYTTLISALIALGISDFAFAEGRTGPQLGHIVSAEDIAGLDISIFPDGTGLPDGRGTVTEGRKIYQQHCLSCHGQNGLGESADQLAGARMGLSSEYPEKTIGAYWPYATTLFDFIRRSMPMNAPRSLSDDEVYAVTAYLLYLNQIIKESDEMNPDSLPKIDMPNENGFINVYETDD